MLNRLFRGSAGLAYAAVRNQPKNIYSRVWKELPDKAFQDRAFCKNFLDINLHKNTKRYFQGLSEHREVCSMERSLSPEILMCSQTSIREEKSRSMHIRSFTIQKFSGRILRF